MTRHAQKSNVNSQARQSGSPAQNVSSGDQPNLSSGARASYFVNQGLAFATRGDFDTASARYREAIALDPNSEIAHHLLGDALRSQENLIEAAKSYARELSINPRACETINTLGTVLQRLGRLDQAVVCYRKALALNVRYAEAHNNLGHVLERLGRLDEAVASYQQAILYKPTLAEAHSNLGSALIDRGDFLKAVESCKKAIALQPGLIECHLRLGDAFKTMGLLSDAVRCYQHCISLSPNYSFAWNNLAEVLKQQGKLEEAVESLQKALGCAPPDPTAYSNLLHFYSFTRHVSPAVERLFAEGWEKSMLTDEERQAARHRSSHASGTFPLRPRAGRRLRVGILSAEVGKSHSVSYFLDPVLKELDRSRFSLTLFPTRLNGCSNAEQLRKLLVAHPDGVISLLGVSDAQAAERIRSEQIDILIETSGHTADCRLGVIAHRAAPVQCTFIGYWGTTGLTEMDWHIAGRGFDASFDAHFTEGIWRLPCFAVCYAGEASLPESAWAPDPDGTIWLGSFNNT
jgi:predicted O-linked N-acetylglucosamine transferase (SPINDLY family)